MILVRTAYWILIDENLNFTSHVNKVLGKMNSIKGILWKCRNVVNISVQRLIYQSLISSHLCYGITIWGKCGIVNINRVKVMQRRVLRQIYGDSSNFTFFEQQILPFNYLYEYFILIKLYAELFQPNSSYFRNKIMQFQTNNQYSTRFNNSDNLIMHVIIINLCYI